MPSGPDIKFIKAPSGGIPGRAGTLLGYATCEVWDTGSTDYTIADTGKEIEVVNWSTSVVCVNGDRYGIAGKWDGKWWIIAEDCANTSEGGVASRGDTETGLTVTDPLGTPQPGTMPEYGRSRIPFDHVDQESTGDPTPPVP